MISWDRFDPTGYEVSSAGDKRFSALYARMPDGRCIEAHYQCDVKGIAPGSSDWRLGKGKCPKISMTYDETWEAYLALWREWAEHHPILMGGLKAHLGDVGVLTDKFARTPVSQARALAQIINQDRGVDHG